MGWLRSISELHRLLRAAAPRVYALSPQGVVNLASASQSCLGESFPTSIYLQNLVSIQPRTSLPKFADISNIIPPPWVITSALGTLAGFQPAHTIPHEKKKNSVVRCAAITRAHTAPHDARCCV